MKAILKKSWALLLCAALIFAAAAVPAFAEESSVSSENVTEELVGTSANALLQIGIMSDMHYYPNALTGNNCAAYSSFAAATISQFDESRVLLDSALYSFKVHAAQNGLKYLLIPGDLTRDGEYEGHTELAAKLKDFEQDTGIQVIVTNGNHDINNWGGKSFADGTMKASRKTTPEEFREIYADLGYDLACAAYTPPEGTKGGMLSYAVQLDGGYRLLVLDTGKYSADTNPGGSEGEESSGQITPGLMAWALEQIEEAKEQGEMVVGLLHHPTVPHFPLQETLFKSFVLDDWEKQCETLADAGMHFTFSGHIHEVEQGSHVSDNGNIIYDVSTPSLTNFPNQIREVLLDNTGAEDAIDVKTFDADNEKPVVLRGMTINPPYSLKYSFKRSFGNGMREMLINILSGIIYDLSDRAADVGLVTALKDRFGLDLEEMLGGLLGGGIKLGSIEIFTAKNLMSFVNDLGAQIEKNFLSDPDALLALVGDLADQILNMKVSNYQCTAFIESLGFGSTSRPGNMQDLAYSVLAYFYQGDQDISGDVFLNDALDYFRNRTGANDLFDLVYDVLVKQLVQGELLSKLQLNIDKLFPWGTLGSLTASMLQFTLKLLFCGDMSYLNVINTVLGLGLFEFRDLDGLIWYFADEYLTQSQLDSLGYTIADLLEGFGIKNNAPDKNMRLTAAAENEVVLSRDNYRLPSMVTVTLGNNAATSRSISWYTKYSARGTDIELIPYSADPDFAGEPTTGVGIRAKYENVTREFPGVDIGIIGFMPVTQKLVRHTIELTDLAPNTKYSYRVGDADKGWWSEPGIIETASGGDSFAFIHATDPQSQNDRQYERFHKVITAAFDKVPGADFIISTGDQVDVGSNVRQWKWLLDISSDVLMNTSFMPTAGNHEDSDDALSTNFVLPNVPAQNTESGVYYHFDYNNARFMVLNTNDLNGDKLSDAQIDWLKTTAKASNAKWKIAALHKAVYSNGSHFDDSDVEAIRKQIQKLMPELGIDVVLQGHDHVYLRTDAMYNNKVVKNTTKTVNYDGGSYKAKIDPYGTIYVISGTSGVKTYKAKAAKLTDKSFPRAESVVEVDRSMFSAFRIEGGKLYFDAYTVSDNGNDVTRIDSFSIEKTSAGAKKPVIILEDIGQAPLDGSVKTAESVDEAELNVTPKVNAAEDGTELAGIAEEEAVTVETAEEVTEQVTETPSEQDGDSVDDGLVFGPAFSILTTKAAQSTTKAAGSTTEAPSTTSLSEGIQARNPFKTVSGDIPKSGSESKLFVVAVLVSAIGVCAVLAKRKKREDEE